MVFCRLGFIARDRIGRVGLVCCVVGLERLAEAEPAMVGERRTLSFTDYL